MSLLQHHMAFLDSQRSMLESLTQVWAIFSWNTALFVNPLPPIGHLPTFCCQSQQWVSRQEELAIAQRPNETYPLSPTMPARGSVMVDPGLREFVSSNGLSPSVAEILAQHDITLDLLMTMNKVGQV